MDIIAELDLCMRGRAINCFHSSDLDIFVDLHIPLNPIVIMIILITLVLTLRLCYARLSPDWDDSLQTSIQIRVNCQYD